MAVSYLYYRGYCLALQVTVAAGLDVCSSQVRCERSRWNVPIRPRPSVESFKLQMILCCVRSVLMEVYCPVSL